MFKFLKSKSFFLKRSFSTNENSLLAQCVKERTLLRLSGNDAGTYLQGLITNDMKHLQDGATSMFTLFLNSSGRVLFDSIIYHSKKDDIFFIECDSEASSFLQSHIKKYKVRRKVSVDSVNDEFDVWTVVNSLACEKPDEMFDYKKLNNVISKTLPDIFTANDPRLPCLGLRILTPKNYNLVKEIENMTDLKMQGNEFYKILRYKLGVGEGMNELPSEKCFPMEINGDYLHGISFHKGCYIGQELTARVYHTGVIRKRIMPLVFDEEVNSNENGIPIFAVPESSKPVGKLQGVEKTNGVGLLRIEEVLKAENLMVLEKKCRTFSPFWWPCEAPKGRMNVG